MLDPCWELLEQLLPQLMRLAPRTRTCDRSVYYDEIVSRWPRLLETWDATRAPLQPYIVISIKWYFSKINARAELHENNAHTELHENLAEPRINPDSLDSVLDSGLTAFEAQLLRLYFVERHTHAELAVWLQVSESQARTLVLRARSRACTLLFLRPALNQIQKVLTCYLENSLPEMTAN